MRALVIGLAATGEAVARRLHREGWDLIVTDDRPGGDAYRTASRRLRRSRASSTRRRTTGTAPRSARWSSSCRARWSRNRIRRSLPHARRPWPCGARSTSPPNAATAPIVAVTGTNGKTTVTSLTAAMLEASGRRAVAAGNIGRTLLDAVDDDADVLVAEVSSFQLACRRTFRPRVAVLLALAEDHLDWHGSFTRYVAAKARIFEHQQAGDLLVFDRDDPTATRGRAGGAADALSASRSPVSRTRFGSKARGSSPRMVASIASIDDMRRALPHDRTNALAAAAAALEVGAHRCRDPRAARAIRDHAPPRRSGRRSMVGCSTSTTRRRPTPTRRCMPSRRSSRWCCSRAGGTRVWTSAC